jgi:twitching motility protein PilU
MNAEKTIHDLLRLMLAKNASDLFITAGFPPAIKVDGKITPVSNQSLTPAHTSELARSIMNERQWKDFEASNESNFAISPPRSAASASTSSCSRAASAS